MARYFKTKLECDGYPSWDDCPATAEGLIKVRETEEGLLKMGKETLPSGWVAYYDADPYAQSEQRVLCPDCDAERKRQRR